MVQWLKYCCCYDDDNNNNNNDQDEDSNSSKSVYNTELLHKLQSNNLEKILQPT